MHLVEYSFKGPSSFAINVVVFPSPLGAQNTPLQPGVCGEGSGGLLKFPSISGGLFSIYLKERLFDVLGAEM